MPENNTLSSTDIWLREKKKFDEAEKNRLMEEAKANAEHTAEKDQRVLEKRKIKKDRLISLIPELSSRNKLIFGDAGIGESSTGEYAYAVDKQVFNVSDKTSLTFGLNSTKKIVLGDNASITLLNGINLDVNLSINVDGGQAGYQDKARVSFTGIAKSLKVGAVELAQMELDSIHPNEVVLPDLNELRLPYGSINTATSERLLGVEFMRSAKTHTNIDLYQCDYSSFRLITKNAISKKDLENPPLVQGLASGDPDVEAYLKKSDYLFEGCGEVKLTESLKSDIGVTQGMGVNMVQYQRGLGRVAYEEMTGMSKSVTYATDQYSNVYCKGAKFTVVCSPHSTEAIYTANSTNNHARGMNTSVTFCAVDLATTLQGVKITPTLIGLDMSTSATKKIRIHTGAIVKNQVGVGVRSGTAQLSSVTSDFKKSELQGSSAAIHLLDVGVEATAAELATRTYQVHASTGRVFVSTTDMEVHT